MISASPQWLTVLAWICLVTSFICAAGIVLDELRRPQKMLVMNFVWPITALYFGPLALWMYFKSGPKMSRQHHEQLQRQAEAERQRTAPATTHGAGPRNALTREQVAVATTHCGAGCTLGDIAGEWWIFSAGLLIAGGELGTRLLLDFLLAWSFGVVFQYFTMAPMRGLSLGKGLLQAMRADTLSIVAFQIGMSIWAVLTYFVFFPTPHLKVNDASFWFMMQIGMILGFFTSYPINIFLVKKGWKEKMPQYKEEMKKNMRDQQIQQQKAA